MPPQRAGDLMTAIALLPTDHYVTFRKEQDEDSPRSAPAWFLSACVFQQAPKDGWPSLGARFRHPSTAPSHDDPCPSRWEHDDSVIFGVSSSTEEPEVLERLLINAITERWGKSP
jgi:hypothetical protein